MPVLTSGSSATVTLGDYDSITLQNRPGQQASITVAGTLVNGAHTGSRTYGPYNSSTSVSITATVGDLYYEVADGVAPSTPGSGSGSVAVQDEGTQVAAAAARLNFRGAGVTASSDGAGGVNVDVPGATGGASGYVYVDLAAAGVTDTIGSAHTAINTAIAAAHKGQGIRPDRIVVGPPGRYRMTGKISHTNRSVHIDMPGVELLVDDSQATPDGTNVTEFLVASTSGWPTSGSFIVRVGDGKTEENITYTGTATGKFTGCAGGSGARVQPGNIVRSPSGANTTTASIRSSGLTGDAIALSVDTTAEVSVSAIGCAYQTVGIPELVVYSANSFPSSGSVTVTTDPAYPGGPTGTATCTYTGKTPYSFTGCVWTGSGVISQGSNVTNGTQTTTTYVSQIPYPFRSSTIRGAQAADTATLAVTDGLQFVTAGSVRVRNDLGQWEYIAYTGRTNNTLTGCTGGTAGRTLADGALVYSDGARDANHKGSNGTRIYCTPTADHKFGVVVKIGSNDRLNPTAFDEGGTGVIECQAEFGRIVGVMDDCIILDRELHLTYRSNPRIITLQPGYWCDIGELSVSYVFERPNELRNFGTWIGGVSLKGYDTPKVGLITGKRLAGPAAGISNCYYSQIGRVHAEYNLSDTSLSQTGYGLNAQLSQGGYCHQITGKGCRHLFTSNAADVGRASLPAAVANSGGIIDFRIGSIVSENPESFPFDTHTDAINVTCGALFVYGGFIKPRQEQGGAAQFRGYYGCGIDHLHYEGAGYAFLAQIAAVNFYIGRITGRMRYLFKGGPVKREGTTTTVSGAVTLSTSTPFDVTVASAAHLPAGPSWVQVPTTDNGTRRLTYTSISGNVLQGCLADGTGSVSSGARVWREVTDDAWIRIGEIDVSPTGGTTLFSAEGGAPLDIGTMTLRYGPESFTPQGSLAHTILSLSVDNAPSESAVVNIGKLVIDLSAYRSAAAIPVQLSAIGMDTRNATKQYDLRAVNIGELVLRFGAGMGNGPGSTKWRTIKGSGIVRDGLRIGKVRIEQSGATPSAFDPVLVNGTIASAVLIGEGEVAGASGATAMLGSHAVSISSATSTLSHLGTLATAASSAGAEMSQRVTVTSASAKATSLQAPAFDGQRWRIACATGSANPLVIASGQISNVGSDLSIPAGSEVVLTGSGGAWFKYAAA